MAYTKTNWTNTTPINTENLNNIENGISNNDQNKLDKTSVKNSKTQSNSDVYSCEYINQTLNKVIVKETILNGYGNRPSALNEWVQTTLDKNPLDYDFLYVTVENSGSSNENITVTLVKQDNQFKSMTGLLYVYDNYRATFQLSVDENSISILVKDILGWTVSNICIINIVGVKITNQN